MYVVSATWAIQPGRSFANNLCEMFDINDLFKWHTYSERERVCVWVGKNWAFFPNALCSLSRDWGIRPETKAICSLHTTWQQILWNFFLKYTDLLCVKVWSEIMINDCYICYCLSNALWWTHERKRFFKFFFHNTFLHYRL